MIVKRYTARSWLSEEAAQRIGEYIEVKFGDEPVTPVALVNAARPKNSPIHRDFEWNDRQAAEKYRVYQARNILRAIEIVYEPSPGREETTRAFHNIVVERSEDDGGVAYVPSRVVWERPDMAEQVVEKAHMELRAWTVKYKQYKKLAAAVAAVETVVEQFEMMTAG